MRKELSNFYVLGLLVLLISAGAQAREKDHDRRGGKPDDGVVRTDIGIDSSVETDVDVDLTFDIAPEATGGTGIYGDVVTEGGRSDVEANSSAETGPSSASTGPVSVVVEASEQRDKVTIKNTPSMGVGDVFPTVSCFKPQINGALSLPGFGFSANKGKIDEGCVKRELIRMAFAMGLIDRAVFMWCKQPEVYEDFGTADDCLVFEIAKEEPTPPPTDTDEITEYGQDETCTGPCEHEGWLMAEVTEEEYRAEQVQQTDRIQELTRRLELAERQTQEVEQTAVQVDDTLGSAINFRSGQRTKAQAALEAFREENKPDGK